MISNYWQAAHEVNRRHAEHGVDYCVIKSYSGVEDYDDGNIDVVVSVPMQRLYEDVYSDAFRVTTKDRLKAVLYERNKLMLTPRKGEMAKIHLHTNAGWHNHCFVGDNSIFAAKDVR